MRVRAVLAVLALSLLPLAACASQADNNNDNADTKASTSATPPGPGPSQLPAACGSSYVRKQDQLTIATDSPAYDPWFSGNDPTNGKGFESAVAYAVAAQLGFFANQIHWVKEPFNNSYKPGPKDFDFDINQISITPDRAKVVDFSEGYYTVAQGIVALKDSPIASATSIAKLADYHLGAQTGTTSLTAIRDEIKPATQPSVFTSNNAAKQALVDHQVDAIVVDLPTAYYLTSAEIKNSTIVGQLPPVSGEQEQFGMLFQKGSKLVPCVNEALNIMKNNGKLDQLQQEWLADKTNVPVLK